MTDQRALKNIINEQREQIKILTAKLVEALSDADKRIGIHKQEIQNLEAQVERITRKLDVYTDNLASQIVNMTNKSIELKTKIVEANKIIEEYGCGECTPAVLLRDVLALNNRKETEESK